MAHVLALGAHRIPVGKRWQAPEVVFDPSVVALMDKVHYEVHQDYVERLTGDAASRPARIEVVARGQTFVGETLYPKGSLSPDPSSRMSNDEISAKFVRNAEGVISPQAIDRALEKLLEPGATRRLQHARAHAVRSQLNANSRSGKQHT